MCRYALALLGIAAAALVAALPVGAKEGVKATLTTSIPLDAPAGTRLKVAWRLFSVGETGEREPFGANGVFVRLLSASGADAEEGLAPAGAPASGEPASERPDSRSTTWVVVVAGALSTLAVLAAALVLHKKRMRRATPASDRELPSATTSSASAKT